MLGVVVPPPFAGFVALEDGKLNAGAFVFVADCGALLPVCPAVELGNWKTFVLGVEVVGVSTVL